MHSGRRKSKSGAGNRTQGMHLTFPAFRANLGNAKQKNTEKKRVHLQELYREILKSRVSAKHRRGICCERMGKGRWNMALEWQG